MARNNGWIKTLVVTNVVTLVCFGYLVIHDKVPQRILTKVITPDGSVEKTPERSLDYRYIYARETIESLVYNRQGFDIVMFGDSLTCNTNWGKLLGRNDIANYGVGGDFALFASRRLKDLELVSPKKCFLMIGINDIIWDQEMEQIQNNYAVIIDFLKSKNIDVWVQSTLYVSSLSKNELGLDYKNINKRVDYLNNWLERYTRENAISYIDINALLKDQKENEMDDKYTIRDGVHLNSMAYEVWKTELKKYI